MRKVGRGVVLTPERLRLETVRDVKSECTKVQLESSSSEEERVIMLRANCHRVKE